jgi:glutamyl-tRNA synthetase
MILRFDDTNPAKEKEEFTNSIQEDLQKLDIVWDRITYSSDYFQMIAETCTRLIEQGLAYCDDTPDEQLKKERNDGIESKRRNESIEQSLAVWNEMQLGQKKEFCVRAKIDFKCPNKCMRDPVIYRHVPNHHARTGSKFKVYPTYDFACPIVDNIEGVTHVMRSNEYTDRNHQYNWFIDNLKLRKMVIHDYSRLNFVSTTLSKRKLNWFVDQKIVDSWDDPRFPTIQGIMRRGMLKSSLLEFILEQGPSKNSNLMEWDKIWAINRKHIEPISLKMTAISCGATSTITIDNFDQSQAQVMLVPFHPKNESLGLKPVIKSKTVIVEREDMTGLKVGDRFLLMKWGVFVVTSASDDLSKLTVFHDKEDINYKDPRKLTWLPFAKELLTQVSIVEYDHLINSKKPDDVADFTQVVNTNSKFTTSFWTESIISTLPERTYIQFERRGYFIVDRKRMVAGELAMSLTFIPDGKTKSMSGLTNNVDAQKHCKGE